MSQSTMIAIVTIEYSGDQTELRLIRDQRINLKLAITDIRVEDANTIVPRQQTDSQESPVCEMLKALERDGALRPFQDQFSCSSPGDYRRLYAVLGITAAPHPA